MRFGGLEILFVFAIVILFFGPKQIPKLTKVMKESISNFKGDGENKNETEKADKDEVKDSEEKDSSDKE